MNPQEVAERIKAKFGEAVLEVKVDGIIDPYLKVAPAAIVNVASFLHDQPDLQFDFLMCLSGVDHGKGLLGVVYNLSSMAHRHKITLKVEVPADKPEVPTVAHVWRTADWHEREAYDLVGITFAGHPDLRRILLPEDYPGHPLRKDFKVPEFYQGMKVPY